MIISKQFTLESSHVLPDHPGKCGHLHGHSWVITIVVDGEVQPSTHMVLDYAVLSAHIDPIISILDHSHLNYYLPWPTAEYIAAFFVGCLAKLSERYNFSNLHVVISETRKTTAQCSLVTNRDFVAGVLADAVYHMRKCDGWGTLKTKYEEISSDPSEKIQMLLELVG